jgi:guanine deaminase
MDNTFMARAIQLSVDNVRSGQGGPFGAVVVQGGRIVAEGANRVTSTNDPTAHAEVIAIRKACAELGSFELRECELYTSCEPCPMCLGAIYWSRLARVYYGSLASDAAQAGFDDSFIYREIAQPLPQRTIPMVQMMREQALTGFRAWKEASNKIPY